jgi:choline-sulfatase
VARAAYYGLCEHIDSLIGQVLDTLDETGLAQDTLVIYTSDHGEMAGEHGCWWKSNYYEGSVGVPLIARWPGEVRSSSETEVVCNLMDVGPTLLEVAGTRFPYPVHGHSLVRILKEGRDESWADETFSEFVDHRGGTPLPCRMIRSGPWKLWVYADEQNLPPALFNLQDDAGELNDLGEDPDYAEVRNRLLKRIHEEWHPKEVARKSQEYWDYFQVLGQWGRTVKPDSPDALVLPPSEYEKDVELL